VKADIFTERRPAMKWKDLGGEERYRVLELVRKGEKPMKQICETFGVSRQVLSRAMEKADRASVEALEPQKPGKKPKGPEEVEIRGLASEKATLEKELEHWKQKNEVAKTFLELERRLERGQRLPGEQGPGEKKTPGEAGRRKKMGSTPTSPSGHRGATGMGPDNDG
jgi:transposase-like protein